MSPEERDELMEFILQSQSNAAARHQETMAKMDRFAEELKEHTNQIQRLRLKSRRLPW